MTVTIANRQLRAIHKFALFKKVVHSQKNLALQSVNEELATINAELQTKVLELSQANTDMNNLLAGTGTVFVDLNLRILRFTPAASRIINLIPSDLGRPVGHIASNLLGYDRLVADVKSVLDTLTPQEIEGPM